MSYFGEPPRLAEPLEFVRARAKQTGEFYKLLIDGNNSNIIVKIDAKKMTGTVAKCQDKSWEEIDKSIDKSSEIDLKKLKGAEKLFNEARRVYLGITMKVY